MKRKRKEDQGGLFDAPAWEQEAQRRAFEAAQIKPPAPIAPALPKPTSNESRAVIADWISARAAALVTVRGMDHWQARDLAEAEFAELEAMDGHLTKWQ